MDITTPTEIARITSMIRAGYLGQSVLHCNYWKDQTQTLCIELHTIEFDTGDTWVLLLRDLSSITDREAIELAFTRYSRINGVPEIALVRLGRRLIEEFSDGQLDGWIYYQYLQQRGFALPFYDSLTRQTITVSQQVDMGIIKIKP